MLPLQVPDKTPQRTPHGPGPQGTTAGNHRSALRFGVARGQILRDEHQRPDELEFALTGPGDGGQRAGAARKQGITQEGLAEIVGGVAEGDGIRAQAAHNLIHRAAAEAAAHVAAVIGLFLKQAQGRVVAMIGPVDSARFQVLAHGFEGTQEFTLLDGEGAHGELDRRALLHQQQGFEERGGNPCRRKAPRPPGRRPESF